jgi:predicted outer membrane protein
MIARNSKAVLLGWAVGLVALATTAVSVSGEIPGTESLASIAAPAARDAAAGQLSAGEQKFVESAYARGLFAIGAGQLAFESSSIHEVRLLAAQILTQQVSVDEKLVALAKTKGMTPLPERLDPGSRESLETLQEASGDDDFELRYCGLVVASYLRDIKAFQGQADTAADPVLRKLASEVVADLKQHLAIALLIQRALARALDDSPTMMTV